MPSDSERKVYRIKPLKWYNVNQRLRYEAHTVIGKLGVHVDMLSQSRLWRWHFGYGQAGDGFKTRQLAQAAAERWYCQQLRKALTEVKP